MRLTPSHGEPGVEVFVYGVAGGPFPARQHIEASKAVARLHGLDPRRTIFAAQNEEAIAAGAFHNDVVAVANGPVLFAHEKAFAERDALVDELEAKVAGFELVEVPDAEVPLADAVKSYLFNAQLVTPPDGAMTLVAPTECRDTPSVAGWIERHLASNGAIRRVNFVDVRQSMANGGGPACLRLRVACEPADVDPRFLVDEAKLDRLAATIDGTWPDEIGSDDIQRPQLVAVIERARSAMLDALDLSELA
jgi:succinylarginine dihydrolase